MVEKRTRDKDSPPTGEGDEAGAVPHGKVEVVVVLVKPGGQPCCNSTLVMCSACVRSRVYTAHLDDAKEYQEAKGDCKRKILGLVTCRRRRESVMSALGWPRRMCVERPMSAKEVEVV
jgi:hypothetical protein